MPGLRGLIVAGFALVLLGCSGETIERYELEPASAGDMAQGSLDINGGDARLTVMFPGGPAVERDFAAVQAPPDDTGYLLVQAQGPTLSFRPTNTPGFWQLEPIPLDREPNPFGQPTMWRLVD